MMVCYLCKEAPGQLTSLEDTASYAVPLLQCSRCGELFYDAKRYAPVCVRGDHGLEAWTRRGSSNARMFPYPADPKHAPRESES